jgi:hypothetical protein
MKVEFTFYCDETRGTIVETVELDDNLTEKEINDELEYWAREKISLDYKKL